MSRTLTFLWHCAHILNTNDFVALYEIIIRWKKKIRVKPLIGDIEESVWNDADEQAKPNDKDLLPKHFNNVQILIQQVLKNRKQKKNWTLSPGWTRAQGPLLLYIILIVKFVKHGAIFWIGYITKNLMTTFLENELVLFPFNLSVSLDQSLGRVYLII